MGTVKTWFDFVLQQMVAESYLDNVWQIASPERDRRLRLGNNNPVFFSDPDDPARANLPGQTRLTDSQIKYFNDTFDILDHRSDDDPRFAGITGGNGTGFSATLIQKKDENGNLTNEYTLSIRSTEYRDQSEGGDWIRDSSGGANRDISNYGFAFAQLDPNNANVIFDDGARDTAVSLDSLYINTTYINTTAQLSDLTFVRNDNDLLIDGGGGPISPKGTKVPLSIIGLRPNVRRERRSVGSRVLESYLLQCAA